MISIKYFGTCIAGFLQRRTFPLALVFVVLGSSIDAQAETTYDSITPWDGAANVFSWGGRFPTSTTYGQTFAVPQNGDEQLLSFTFIVRENDRNSIFDGETPPIEHLAAVYEWDTANNRIIGSALFSESGTTDGSETFQPLVYTPDVLLEPSRTYVAFLSASRSFSNGVGEWAQPQNQDFIPGGQFVFQNNDDDFDALFTSAWELGFLGSGNDVAAQFVFGTPPPALSCEGFLFPMDRAVTVKRSPYGGDQPSVLPLMMRLLDEDGVPVYGQDLSSPPVLEVLFDGYQMSEVGPVPEELPYIGYGDDDNRFEFINAYWQFYLATSGFGSTGTYYVSVVSGDESEYSVDPTCTATFTIVNPFSWFRW